MYLTNEERIKLLNYIKPKLTDKRYLHTLGTEKMAIKLAELSGEDISKAQTAAILHDSCKCISEQEKRKLICKYNIQIEDLSEFNVDLVHGHIASYLVQEELGITDKDVINAIAFHTTGRPGMSRLEKIIYSADVVEENRKYDVADYLRDCVYKDIDKGTYIIMNHVLQFLLVNNQPIYNLTVSTYNSLLKEYKNMEGQGV